MTSIRVYTRMLLILVAIQIVASKNVVLKVDRDRLLRIARSAPQLEDLNSSKGRFNLHMLQLLIEAMTAPNPPSPDTPIKRIEARYDKLFLAADDYRMTLRPEIGIKHTKASSFVSDTIEKTADIRSHCKREVRDILHGTGKVVHGYSTLLQEHAVPLAFDDDLPDLERLKYLLENVIIVSTVADKRDELKHKVPCQAEQLVIDYQNFRGTTGEKSKYLAKETLDLINSIRLGNGSFKEDSFYY